MPSNAIVLFAALMADSSKNTKFTSTASIRSKDGTLVHILGVVFCEFKQYIDMLHSSWKRKWTPLVRTGDIEELRNSTVTTTDEIFRSGANF